jgi:hypothetical protein
MAFKLFIFIQADGFKVVLNFQIDGRTIKDCFEFI